MNDRVNQPYSTEGSRVYGMGTSYNCTNVITAKELCNRLNQYEHDINLEKNITEQYDRLTKQIIQIQLTLGILNDDINKIKETINAIHTTN